MPRSCCQPTDIDLVCIVLKTKHPPYSQSSLVCVERLVLRDQPLNHGLMRDPIDTGSPISGSSAVGPREDSDVSDTIAPYLIPCRRPQFSLNEVAGDRLVRFQPAVVPILRRHALFKFDHMLPVSAVQ